MTTDEVKAFLRMETGGEDALIVRLVASARALCEAFLGQVLLRRAVTETLAPASGWRRLAARPVQAITLVERVNVDGSASVLGVDAYAVDIDASGDGWVRGDAGARLRVTYRAGLAENAGDVPAAIADGVTRLAAHLYENRATDTTPPAAVAALWRPFRRLSLTAGERA